VVRADGSVQRPPEQKPAAFEQASAWEIQYQGQVMGPFGLAEMRDLSRAGRLSPDTPVRAVGGGWTTASAFAPLAVLFAAPAPAPAPPVPEPPPGQAEEEGGAVWCGTEDQCYAHADSPPVFLCGQCGRYLCESCIKASEVKLGLKPLKLCSACGGMAKPFEKRVRWPAFYRDMGQVLLAPLKGHALLYFGLLAFLQIIKVPAGFAPLFGLFAVIILTCFQFTFYLHLIKQVAHGSYGFPEWPETSAFGDMFFSFLKVIGVVIICLIPVIIVGVFAGVGLFGLALASAAGGGNPAAVALPFLMLAAVLVLFYYFYLPIPIGIVAVFDTILPALNPVLIFRIIGRIGGPYFAAYALWLAFTVISKVFALLLAGIPVLGAVIAAPIDVYFTLTSAYVLGRLIFENESKIGWT
jgi:hypothetical protein